MPFNLFSKNSLEEKRLADRLFGSNSAVSQAHRLRNRNRSPVAFCAWLATAVSISPAPAHGEPAEGPSSAELREALTAYFHADGTNERAALAQKVDNISKGSVARVAEALRHVHVWSHIDGDEETLTVDLGAGRRADRLRILLPPDYDPGNAHPLVLVLAGASSSQLDSFDREWLKNLRADFVLAMPLDVECGRFHAPAVTGADPRRWLQAVRRRYHINTDRVYLYGSHAGADAALNILIMHADAFASAIIREGNFEIPYPRELLPLLLPNLQHTPTILVWTRPELPPGKALSGRHVEVALSNMLAMQAAHKQDLPITRQVLTPAESPDVAEFRQRFALSRPEAVKRFSHRFRYPGQGRARFLRHDGVTPPLWEGDQIVILARRQADQSAYATEVLLDKLASFSGSIAGQKISITSTGVQGVKLYLRPGHLDLSTPVHIVYNGKRRLEDRVPVKVGTLLKSAYDEWEFQHPSWVRLRIGAKGRVLPF
jgi:hypothetical protein